MALLHSCTMFYAIKRDIFYLFQIQDFSGDYKVSLIPCFATLTQKYSLPLKCTPGNIMTFDLPIRFQQVSDPVATKFSLNTEFYLVRKKDLWLSKDIQASGIREEDTAFAPGNFVYIFLWFNPYPARTEND